MQAAYTYFSKIQMRMRIHVQIIENRNTNATIKSPIIYPLMKTQLFLHLLRNFV